MNTEETCRYRLSQKIFFMMVKEAADQCVNEIEAEADLIQTVCYPGEREAGAEAADEG